MVSIVYWIFLYYTNHTQLTLITTAKMIKLITMEEKIIQHTQKNIIIIVLIIIKKF